MTTFTIDTTSPESFEQIAALANAVVRYLNETDDTYHNPDCLNLTEFLLAWFAGDIQKTQSEMTETRNRLLLAEQQLQGVKNELAELNEVKFKRRNDSPFCMPEYRRQTSEVK